MLPGWQITLDKRAYRQRLPNRRPTGRNPFQLPRGTLLMPGDHILRRDVADGAVQTDVIVMVYVTLTHSYHRNELPSSSIEEAVISVTDAEPVSSPVHIPPHVSWSLGSAQSHVSTASVEKRARVRAEWRRGNAPYGKEEFVTNQTLQRSPRDFLRTSADHAGKFAGYLIELLRLCDCVRP